VSEEEVKRSIYISEVPAGGTVTIKYKGRVIARRTGGKDLEVF
jgi:antitoxin (DNA-binding transcriptional repressor) of toxin-antitoxin stability system